MLPEILETRLQNVATDLRTFALCRGTTSDRYAAVTATQTLHDRIENAIREAEAAIRAIDPTFAQDGSLSDEDR